MKKTAYLSLLTTFANLSNKALILSSVLFSAILSNAQTTVTFTTPGATTWTVPDCVSSITVQVWSGGGGGGGSISILRNSSDGEACSGAGGGGGGGYTSQTFAVTSGQVYNLVIGAGGTAGTAGVGTWNGGITTAPGTGGTGGTSSFMNFGINLVSTGGIGGNGAGAYNNNNPPDANVIGAPGAGGVGSGGTVFYNGGSGAAGYILWTGTDKSGGGGGAAGPGGPGGNAPLGNSYGIIDNNSGGLGSAPGGTGGNSRMNNLPSNTSKNGGNGNLIGAGGGGGLNHKDGYGAVSASGGAGARGEIRITYTSPVLPATPTISSTAPTCSAAGSSTISNYNAGYTYIFSPAGPTVGAGGVISGMVVGTSYTVIANDGTCNSSSSATFSNAPALTAPTTPTISSTAPSCGVNGSSTVSNYNAGYTYIFSPAGPTVGAGGAISGMVVGTTYTVTASNGSCSSSASANFSNSAMLPVPPTPTRSSTAPTCSAAGSSTISNYNAGYTYTFTPAGPTVGAGGAISGMVVGTSYTVTANNGSCTSTASASFSNAPALTIPSIPTISSTAPSCGVNGSSTVSNYNAGYTYIFSPAGPTVGAGGAISGMVVGTTYTVTASNGSCSSSASANFSNAAALSTPSAPTVNTTAATCSAASSSTITNYNAGYTYSFSPPGPTVGAGGVISGMSVGTTYQVTANNGSCTSTTSNDFSYSAILSTPSTPTISSTAPSCGVNGSSTVSNYNAGLTYIFSPAGPTVGAGGAISGMVVGTNYQVTASNGSCSSSASVDFSNLPMLTVPPTPTISSTAPTCSAAGSSTISNYNAGYTYNFTPAGPTVGVGGAISGMVVGTSYTVTANNGSCTSTASASFSNAPALTVPSISTISSTAPTCSAAGSSTISNYNAGLTYIFSPAGPTVGAGGAISGMVVGTNYQVAASNGSCSSSASVDFSNLPMLTVPPTPTISSTAPTCSAAGSSTISNYNAGYTYNFTPAGPTVGAGGAISGMVVGTSYTVTANNGSCTSTASASFSNAPTLTVPSIPTISSTAPTCSAAGSSTISNYNAGYTYIFSPAGPTVGVGGVISGMVVGTNYNVTASNGSCSSSASVDFSNLPMLTVPPTPTISSTAPTCSAAGSSTISNYNAGYTYNFTPAGPTVGVGGVISGMVVGTSYTVTANNGSCTSTASSTFSNAPTLTVPSIPTISSTAPTCSAAGSSTISNYNAGLTYIFSPAGPTVGAGGAISGMVVGTNYQVTASNGSCSSSASVDFSNLPMLTVPPTPTISSTAPTCSAAGSSTISNYNAGYTYNFTPAGPTVGVGGVISGMVVGTSYTVTANNGSCTSTASANFSNSDILPSPIVTVSSNAVCEDGTITLTPTIGGTWVSNNTSVATVTAGGVVSIVGNGSVDFTFTATNTCTATTSSVTVNSIDDASFNYSGNTHCLTGTNPVATVTGTTGGTFTISPPGVLVDTLTGEIDLLASGLGTFTITYNTAIAGNPCPKSTTTSITITNAPSAAFSYDAAQYCQDSVAPILTFGAGSSAGLFSSLPVTGLSLNTSNGDITLSTSTAGIYTVYNTITPSGGCAEARDSTIIEILQLDDASFNYTTGNSYCLTGTNPVATLTGTTGGTFTISPPGVLVDTLTGEIDLLASGLGTVTVYYNTPLGNACPQQDSTVINIVNAPGASFTYNTPFCEGDANALPIFAGNNFSGTFSSNPFGVVIFVDTLTGEIDLTTTPPGTYTIYNNLFASGGCAAALDSFEIIINPIITTPQSAAICQGDSILLGGMYQTIAGVYADTLTGSLGCDSIVATTLIVNPILTTLYSAAICQGDSILLGGTYQTIAGVYADTLTGSLGCDSIVATTLTINPIITTPQSAAICQGDSILLGGMYQTIAGFYADTLTGSLGCDSIVETTLTINPPLSVIPDVVTPICFGKTLLLTATGSGNGTVTWYSDAAGTNVIGTGSPFDATSQVSTTGNYTFYVNEAGTCSSTLTAVNVTVGGVTAAITATPTSGFMPLDVVFGNNSSTGATYDWNFGDGTPSSNVTDPTHTYTNLGNYTATLIVTDGVCFDTATVIIEVVGQSTILIPNVFTPNGDGSNDVFTVEGTNLESVEGVIFNRWGQQLFSWDRVKGSWDGRTLAGVECPDGTYFYIIKAKGNDGAEYAKNGAFSLIR